MIGPLSFLKTIGHECTASEISIIGAREASFNDLPPIGRVRYCPPLSMRK